MKYIKSFEQQKEENIDKSKITFLDLSNKNLTKNIVEKIKQK